MQEAIEGATFAAFAQQRAALADQAAKRDAAAQFNTSGITPLDVRVLVRPDAVAEKVGGIFLPDSVKDQDKFAQQKATLIAVGANAWCEAKAGAGFVAPEPGGREVQRSRAGDARNSARTTGVTTGP